MDEDRINFQGVLFRIAVKEDKDWEMIDGHRGPSGFAQTSLLQESMS